MSGDKLLTTGNAGGGADAALFAKLGLLPMQAPEQIWVGAELALEKRPRSGRLAYD